VHNYVAMRRVLPGLIVAILAGCHGELIPLEQDPPDPPPGADGGASTATAFRPGIQTDMDSAGCTATNCHALAGTPMLVLAAPTDDLDWQANYEEVAARSGNPSSSLLIAKPSGLGGHVTVLAPSSPMIDRWAEWIDDGVPFE